MKKVFVYGILQQKHSGEDFRIKKDNVIGRATAPNYKRICLTQIVPTGNEEDSVEGEVIEIPDEIEEELYRFEKQFGYARANIKAYVDDEDHEAICYLV